MGLLDLPAEILTEIINHTVPSGIEALSLCCKGLYAHASKQIQQHNALKQQWNYTSHTGIRRGDTLRMLYDIFRDPRAAQYIESLNLWDRRSLREASEHSRQASTDGFDDFRANREAMKGIKRMVMELECLQKAGVDAEEWWDKIMNENKDVDREVPYTVVTLLSLLPNLKTLRLPHAWHDARTPDDVEDDDKILGLVLDAIVDSSNNGKDRDRPLKKLETILPFMWEGYEERGGLQGVESFLHLKSIRELYAVSCIAVDDHYTGIPFHWRFPTLMSSITRIELAYCCIDADGISGLLSYTPNLKVFKYAHQTKWHGCQHDWNPGAFTAAVAKHCGRTITELAITIDELFGDICNGTSSFHAFPDLQKLEVDLRIFCGPPVESGQERGMLAKIPEGETPWTEDDIPCVGSMLPGSIIELQMNMEDPEDETVLRLLFKDIKEQRRKRLTLLEKVIVRQLNGHSARKFVEDSGLTLEVFDAEYPTTRPNSMMPAWKREFQERVGGLDFFE
ncbi:hypothetical protein BU16DRAFT_507952 [Lophium mytilinum]|uniref:F-box domain-containing protein n=1 Tax=Lophium mytilinum TaxID=390894 RepID=A0A6A6QXB0_9PEZI|nr:hypothetical protein BU16DRAFT_507952 [Lophium mytilinum]